MFKQIKVLAAVAAVMLIASLTACNTTPGGGGDGGGEGGETVNIGIKYNQPGLGLQVGNDYEGFDVDVARYVANELGYSDINFVDTPSAQRENMIMGGQVDLIFATYSITDSRKEQVSFAGPYYIAHQDLLVRTDDTSINSTADLDGKKLCSVSGSTSADNIKEEVPGVDLQEFPDYAACVTALANGSVDAVTTDNVILAGFAAQDEFAGKLRVLGETFSDERYGVGLEKGNIELCEQVNEAIVKMIESGEWAAAIEKHLGPAGFEVPEPPAQDACS